MPPKKGARTPSPKKTPKSSAKKRSRSVSRSRKTSSRSRSRSAGRKAPASPKTQSRTPTSQKEAAPALPVRLAPSQAAPAPKTPPHSPARSPARVTKLAPALQVMEEERPIREKVVVTTRRRVTTETHDVVDGSTSSAAVSKPAGDAGGETTIGPVASLSMIFIVIGLTYSLALACNKKSCAIMKLPVCPDKLSAFFNAEVTLITFGFFALFTLLMLLPVGHVTEGLRLKDGRRLKYRCNGMWSFLFLTAVFAGYIYNGFPLDYFEKHLLQFVTGGLIFAFVGASATLLYWWNCPPAERSPGSDGTVFNDFWMGRPLNPRLLSGLLDIKFTLFRIGLFVWLLVDWIYLALQYTTVGVVSPALSLVVLFHTLYIVFALRNEAYQPGTGDFQTQGIGFFYYWFPSFLIIVAVMTTRFLYLYPQEAVTNTYCLAALFAANAFGMVMFNGANWQKSEFRKNPQNPELSHLTSMSTSSGKSLLISGWWGTVRRPNYLGDLIMALAWSLPCGFTYALPYLYPVYLAALLVPRCIEDEKSCRQRYGDADWDKYTSIVKYRLIPYVF